MVTNANDFVINGLPELIVSPDPSSNLFTIDGQHIDQAISASDRYSTLVVAEGAVLGIGSAVSQVSADGFGWDLSTVNAFESAFGRLDWVTDAQRTSNSLLFFQPENRLVWLEVTGPVRIDGTVHMAGMHGGENPRLDHPSGPGQARLGGITSDTLSGGVGGAGGVTQGGTTHDGQRAGGNNTPDLGVGRGANGTLLLTQQPAGFGSRFDPVNESLNDFIEDAVEVVSSLVSIATGATALAAGSPGGLIDIATGVAGFISVVSELPTTDSLASGQVVAGQGGHGGLRPSGIGPDLEDDFQVLPGGGGGGGGGGGSSYYEETFFSIPLDTSKEIGGGGAGGGGAAGALRITTASALEIGPNGTINGSGGRGGFGEPHRWLGSPSGGGGGGAGGVAKLQGSRLLNRGIIDLSGGARSGAIIAQGDLPVPVGRYGDGRVQILDGPQKGGFLYYGSDNIGVHPPTVHMAWPTGRLRASITLPFTGIRGVGTAEHIPFLFIGALRGLLVITDDRRLVLMSVPDYFSGTPQIAYLAELADLQQISALAGFTPTDAAQSPVPPQHIFVSGMRTVNGAVQSQIHEFDAGGNYLGLAFSTTTSGYVDFVGHLQEIDFLSDGRLAALMATAPTINASGIHVIDLATGTASLLIPGEDNLVSMSVLRGGQGEIFYAVIDDRTYACDGVCPVPTAIKRYDTSGQEVDLLALVTETVSSPGEPGLLRLDGSLPASRAPRLQFDGFDLPDLRYPVGSNTEATFNSPAIGSLEAPAGSATGMENLVIGRIFGDQVTLFCQGGEEGESAVVFKNGLPVTLTPPADSSGQFEVPLQLDLGFNTVWVETNRGGDTHELLKRHILLIRTPLFPYR
jgi:hypothetical protein